MTLTAKQMRFVDEYVVTRCGAEAARRAGHSARTARSIASKNLTKPDILAEIAAKETELADVLSASPILLGHFC